MGGNTFPGFENVVTAMGEIHARIHQGLFYQSSIVEEALAASASVELLIKPAAIMSMHTRFIGAAGGDARVSLWEDTVVSDDGTPLDAVNRNRRSQRVATGQVYAGPTITEDGANLHDGAMPGGALGQTIGSTQSSFEEWILLAGKTYMARLVNLTNAAQLVSLEIDWYEPFGKLR